MVAPLVIGSILEIGKTLIDKLFPDPTQKAEATYKLLTLQQAGEFKEMDTALELAKGQMQINLEEAKSESLFKSGWRPAVGWTCVLGLFYNYLGQPILAWYSSTHALAAPPTPDLGDLIVMLGGLLGFGTLRSYDKKVGSVK
jgi:hypothetical protein